MTISKTSDKSLYSTNSPAIFTITIQNPGAFGVTIDKITDELPAGFTFQSFDATSQVTASNSTSVPVAGATGTITFEGGVISGGNTSYYIPAGGSIILKYTATSASSSATNLLTNARDYIGTTEVGVAQNTVSVSATLPVTLLFFKANKVNEGIKLQWVTSNEMNSSIFEVERSNGNGAFIKIGKIAASGISSGNISYSFIDSIPGIGTNNYRIKMIDQNQQYKYSRVISIASAFKGFEMERVYPNPVSDYTKFYITSDKDDVIHLKLYDVKGDVVLVKDLACRKGTNTFVLDQLAFLQTGTYMLQISGSEGNQQQKIVKIK